ncbi:MAG: hypothetical protein PUE85_01010 [Firmicutes bacterium]|nr:hypothetical protein [Bacillota bacterium]
MKRLITCVLIAALCLTCFAACNNNESNGLTRARDYLFSMYKDAAEITASDFQRVNKVTIDGTVYDIEWTAEITSGPEDGVKIVNEENTVTVDVNEKTSEEIVYTLKASVKDASGKTEELKFNHKVPVFKESSWAAYAEASDGDSVVVKGVVTGIIAKSKGNSSNCLYMQDSDGGYYVYNLAEDPVSDLNIEAGMTVRVTGKRTTYNGTYEIEEGSVEILDTNKTEIEAVDYTEKFTSAESLKDSALVSKQALLVTVKGVEVTDSDVSKGYYKFKLGEFESYVRISSSVCPLTKDEQSALKEGHAEHLGWTADVTGVICVYDGAFYLTPVSAEAFKYNSLPSKDDAEMVAFEKENLKLPEKITEDTVIDLNTTGQGYESVSVSWTSDNDCAVIDGSKLKITLPDNETVVKITAVLTSGSASETVVFEINVDSAPKETYTTKIESDPSAGKAYKFVLDQKNAGKIYYFTGEMDGNYLATSDRADKAVDVFVEETDGGIYLYFMNGDTKTYIEIYEYQENKGGVKLTSDTPASVMVWNADSKTYTSKIGENTYYLGTYKTYTTFSVSNVSYISDDNAANVDVSQFPGRLATVSAETAGE